jgi:RAD54-like protein 2
MQFEQKQINDAKKLHREFLDDDEEEEEDEDDLSDLIDDNDDEDENDNGSVILDDDNSNSAKSVKRVKNKRKTRSAKLNGADSSSKSSVGSPAQDSEPAWWDDLIEDDMEYKISISGKMEVFFEILQRCEEINDKILVFSHSLFSLELIEKFLKHWTRTKRSRWLPLVDYFRIDGNTEGFNRKKYINEFNDPTSEVRLFLISTKGN